jgi:mannose-6-phosphate isomerase
MLQILLAVAQCSKTAANCKAPKMLYPYKFTPLLQERVWGGNALEHYGKSVPPGKRIGESWEISDRDDVQSVIANGPDKGKTLRQQIEAHGAQLLG